MMENHVDDLLEMSKQESGKYDFSIKLQPFNLLEVICNVFDIVSFDAFEKKVELKASSDGTESFAYLS
jgi:signal transduction histidine kinase